MVVLKQRVDGVKKKSGTAHKGWSGLGAYRP